MRAFIAVGYSSFPQFLDKISLAAQPGAVVSLRSDPLPNPLALAESCEAEDQTTTEKGAACSMLVISKTDR